MERQIYILILVIIATVFFNSFVYPIANEYLRRNDVTAIHKELDIRAAEHLTQTRLMIEQYNLTRTALENQNHMLENQQKMLEKLSNGP